MDAFQVRCNMQIRVMRGYWRSLRPLGLTELEMGQRWASSGCAKRWALWMDQQSAVDADIVFN